MKRKSVIDMSSLMASTLSCDTCLSVAKNHYPDLLPGIRDDVARAMSAWLDSNGFRAIVRWSEEESCFFGSLRHVGAYVTFRGETAAALKEAFEKAVRDYMVTLTEELSEAETEAEPDIAA